MPITLSDGSTTLALDEDLYWSDEADWHPVVQSEERSITGALILQSHGMASGRPITLEPEDDSAAWMPRAALLQLRSWAQVPGLALTLVLRDAARTVVFRHGDSDGSGAISARSVQHYSDAAPADWYLCTLRFLEVL